MIKEELWLTEDIFSLGLGREQRFADAIDVLSHDPDDVLSSLDQLGNLRSHRHSNISIVTLVELSLAPGCHDALFIIYFYTWS